MHLIQRRHLLEADQRIVPIYPLNQVAFFRRALLDGPAGVTYATLQSNYEYLIVIKTKELRKGGA